MNRDIYRHSYRQLIKGREQRAIENGILDKAFDNAKELIEKTINNSEVKEQGYKIRFVIIEQLEEYKWIRVMSEEQQYHEWIDYERKDFKQKTV